MILRPEIDALFYVPKMSNIWVKDDLGARAHGNAMNRSIQIEICLLWGQRRDIYEKSSALITTFLI